MPFTIAHQHRRATFIFLVKEERDEIFIAAPKGGGPIHETIFLTKTGDSWVGDYEDKKLVLKIGREIDAVREPVA